MASNKPKKITTPIYTQTDCITHSSFLKIYVTTALYIDVKIKAITEITNMMKKEIAKSPSIIMYFGLMFHRFVKIHLQIDIGY
jgi:hypothetical protein